MPTYLASYKVGKNNDDNYYSIADFKRHAEIIRQDVPQISGIEIRFGGNVVEERCNKKIVSGLSLEEINNILDFIGDRFNACGLHLSKASLALLQGAKTHGQALRDTVDFLENFAYVVGHYGEHESLWGQAIQDNYLRQLRNTRFARRHSFRQHVNAILGDGIMPAHISKLFLIENGFEPFNTKAKVHEYAIEQGLAETTDLGHFIMGNFDEDPKLGGMKHDTRSMYVNLSGKEPQYNEQLLRRLGENTVHLHVHGCNLEYQINSADGRKFKRFKDHYPFTARYVSPVQRALLERLVSGTRPTLRSCAIELNKKFNSPSNIKTSLNNLEKWFLGGQN